MSYDIEGNVRIEGNIMYVDELYKSEKISVAGLCLQSNPCQHDVFVDGKLIRMNALEIVKLFNERSEPIPKHFNYVVNMHRRPNKN